MPEPRGNEVTINCFVDDPEIAQWNFNILKSCPNFLVFKEAEHSGIIHVRVGVCRHENSCGADHGTTLQTKNVWHSN
eukprot:scaffold39174_cov30-Attheya_sp.AAC.4